MKFFCLGWMVGLCGMGLINGHISNITYMIGFMLSAYTLGQELAKDNC